jgi:hypothetical protein
MPVVYRFASRTAAAACMAEVRRLTSASVWTDVRLLRNRIGEIAVEARVAGAVEDILLRYGGRRQPDASRDLVARSLESAIQARAIARRAVESAEAGVVAGREALDRAKRARVLLAERRG